MALEDAIYLARTCEKVYLIHRRDSLRGAMVLQEELKSLPNVEILYDHVVTEICGEDMVEKLRIKNVKTEAEKDLEAAGIFIAVGIHPNTELLRDWWQSGKTVISLRMRPERPAAPAFMWPEISVRNLCARS